MHAIRLTEDEIKLRNIIANNLKIIRKQNKLSQKEVALKLNCTFQQVGKYEKATNTLSSIKLKKLADMFNLPVERFYFPIETVKAQTQEIKIAH
jgi:transcriptional regulator with XRE-family HTH domain